MGGGTAATGGGGTAATGGGTAATGGGTAATGGGTAATGGGTAATGGGTAATGGGSAAAGGGTTAAGGGTAATGGGTAAAGGGTASGGGTAAPGTIPLSPTFGFDFNGTQPGNYATIPFGTQRIWDSPPLQWQTMNTADGVYSSANLDRLDTVLAHDLDAGTPEAWYTMARTPNWASSAPQDANCNYSDAGAGACDRPDDLNADGTGMNTHWKTWVTFIATHANDATYLQTHAHIRYWEPWNEPDTSAFWGSGAMPEGHGSYSALVRLVEDARCIITGKGVIHNTPSLGMSTPCTATAIDPTALIVSPSYHGLPASTSQAQNFLYCNNSPTVSCNTGDAGMEAIDVLNFHLKPGAGYPASMESTMNTYVANIKAILKPGDLARVNNGSLLLYDGEASYSPKGFQDTGTCPGGPGCYTDPDMAASFTARMLLYNYAVGVTATNWYTWDDFKLQQKAVKAYEVVEGWMVGATMITPCAPVTTDPGVYTCELSRGGKTQQVIWDNSKQCSAGTCTTAMQTVPTMYTKYVDILGNASVTLAAHSEPVGIEPLLKEH